MGTLGILPAGRTAFFAAALFGAAFFTVAFLAGVFLADVTFPALESRRALPELLDFFIMLDSAPQAMLVKLIVWQSRLSRTDEGNKFGLILQTIDERMLVGPAVRQTVSQYLARTPAAHIQVSIISKRQPRRVGKSP